LPAAIRSRIRVIAVSVRGAVKRLSLSSGHRRSSRHPMFATTTT
jgi:hypothetical protein